MKVILNACCLVSGVMLLMWGRRLAYSLGGSVRYVLTGAPGEKPVYLMVGGGILAAFGFYQLFWNQK